MEQEIKNDDWEDLKLTVQQRNTWLRNIGVTKEEIKLLYILKANSNSSINIQQGE